MANYKPALLNLLRFPGATALLAPFRRGRAAVFMLHRFTDPATGIVGHDPEHVRAVLRYLQGEGYEFVALTDLFGRLAGDGPPLRRAVAFTIDDGYREHATVAAPLFAEFQCPVTTFVTTGFLDGDLFFWWDRIEYILRHTRRRHIDIIVDSIPLHLSWETTKERDAAQERMIEKCKRIPDAVKELAIADLAATAEVEFPADAPVRYQPMTWNELRAAEDHGMTFGPHTVTHPVLSRTTEEQAGAEIKRSWERLQEEAQAAIPVFCYPNGQYEDFGLREMACLQSLQFLGAVVGIEGYADSQRFRRDPLERFQVPRFSFPDTLPQVIQAASGFEGAKRKLRGQA